MAVGRFLLERGADPRQVLELVYDPLRKEAPDFVDVYFATAELALEKYDNALAAETLRTAPRARPAIRSIIICWPGPTNPTTRNEWMLPSRRRWRSIHGTSIVCSCELTG